MNNSPGRYKKAFRWFLTFVCVGYIVWFFLKNTQELKLVSGLNPVPIVGIGVFSFLGHAIFSVRFQIILKKYSDKKVPLFHWFRIVILGRFLSLLAPQAGNIYRSVALKKNYGVSYTKYAGTYFSFVWMDMCINLIIAEAVIILINPGLMIGRLRAVYLIAVILFMIIVVPILARTLLGLINFKNNRLSWLHGKLSEMLSISVNSLRDSAFMLKMLLTGLVAFADTIAIFYFCFRALDMPIDIPALALFFVILRLSTSVTITPGNLGVRELAYGIISANMQFSMAEGILISLVIRVVGSLVTIFFGAVFGGLGLLRGRSDYLPGREQSDAAKPSSQI